MTQDPGFGAALTLLLDQRELHPTELAERAGLGADEVRTVLAGSVPAREQVRRLAAALGFHALDLFVLAGLAVPDDLAPPDHTAHHRVRQIVVDAARLPPTERRSLLRRVRSLPREERRTPSPRRAARPAAAARAAGSCSCSATATWIRWAWRCPWAW